MGESDRSTLVGLDTSVVVRLLVGSPADLAQAALDFVRQSRIDGVKVVVSDLVVREAYFALHAHYDFVEPADGPGILTVLTAAVRSSARPGFVDRLIHDQYRRASARRATFEHAAGRLAGTTVLAAKLRRR